MYSIYDNSSTLDRFYTPAARPCVNSSLEEKQQKEKNKSPNKEYTIIIHAKKGINQFRTFLSNIFVFNRIKQYETKFERGELYFTVFVSLFSFHNSLFIWMVGFW